MYDCCVGTPIFAINRLHHSELLLQVYQIPINLHDIIITFILHLFMSGHVFQSCKQLVGNHCKFLENIQCAAVIVSPILLYKTYIRPSKFDYLFLIPARMGFNTTASTFIISIFAYFYNFNNFNELFLTF